jgi:hypothetical protein
VRMKRWVFWVPMCLSRPAWMVAGAGASYPELCLHRPQRNARWPGAAANDVAIEIKLNRLLPIPCSKELAPSRVFLHS